MKLLLFLAVLLSLCEAGRKDKHKRRKDGWQTVKATKVSRHHLLEHGHKKSGKPGIRYKIKDDALMSFNDAQRTPTANFWTQRGGRDDGVITKSLLSKGLLGKGDLAIADPDINGEKMETGAQRQILNAAIGSGWTYFSFGRTDTMSNRRFAVQSPRRIIVRVVDLFCTGDRFRVLAIVDGKQVSLGTTSHAHSDDCQTTTADPDWAYVNGFWSLGEFVLPAGKRYIILLQVVSSTNGGGTASIRFDYDPDEGEEESTDPTIYSATPEDAEEEDDDEVVSGDDESYPEDDDESLAPSGDESYPSEEEDDDDDDDAPTAKSLSATRNRKKSKRRKSHYCCEISGKTAERLSGGAIKRSTSKAKKANGLTSKQKKRIADRARKDAALKKATSAKSLNLPNPEDPSFLKYTCAGMNGFFVVNIPSTGREIATICKHYRGIPAQLSDSANVKTPARETLKKCVGAKATAWIGGHNGHKDQYSYGATLRKDDSIEVRAVEPTILHPVMCQLSRTSS